jgi:myosin III
VGENKLLLNFFPKLNFISNSSPLRRAVWKIPFRLDEIPFFDTRFLCETAQVTHFTTFDEEMEPWDAPLRRRANVSSHISYNLYNKRESIYPDIDEDDSVIVNEPFNRDPNVPMNVMIKLNVYLFKLTVMISENKITKN